MQITKFLSSNAAYVIWFLIYFTIAWIILGANLSAFIIASIIYGISITIALSPSGEAILRSLLNCREISTQEEKNYLIPIFDEVFQNAKEADPNLNDEIRLYIMDAMYVNAFAIGRRTIAVTKGAIATWTQDELKGILAHELGHMTYGHTKALLLSNIGNFFFSVIAWGLTLILRGIMFISGVVAFFNIVGIAFSILTFITKMFVDVSIFVFINLGEIILAMNSRTNEIQADTFAFEIGYGKELISAMYLLQKISINANVSLAEKMKASHPHIAYRIGHLENLESSDV